MSNPFLDEVNRKLIAPRQFRSGQRVALRCGMPGEFIALGPQEGQATIRLDEMPDLELVVDAAKLVIDLTQR